jgi:hypothetical protein
MPSQRSQTVDGTGCNCLNVKAWALNSAVECHPHTVEVVGSNPTAPTTLEAAQADDAASNPTVFAMRQDRVALGMDVGFPPPLSR